MAASLNVKQTLKFTVAPVDAGGNPVPDNITNLAFVSSDTSIFTVGPDPTTPNGGIITAVKVGVATITASATDTNNGNTLTGTAEIDITEAPAPVAVALGFTFSTPQ